MTSAQTIKTNPTQTIKQNQTKQPVLERSTPKTPKQKPQQIQKAPNKQVKLTTSRNPTKVLSYNNQPPNPNPQNNKNHAKLKTQTI